ncbi:MAG: amidohydrolase family protein [Candidatus Latescibacterota bacterium]
MIPIVDTHQHLWDLEQFSLPWLADVEALNDNYRMDDYQRATAESGVAKTVYMEVDVAPEQRLAEVDFVSDLCARDDNPMAGAVISGSPGDAGFADYMARFSDNAYVKGVRQVLHVPSAARGACVEPRFVEGMHLLGSMGKCFDLCMRPSELGDAVALVEQCSDTLFIVDHCGNADPQIVSGDVEPDLENPFSHDRQQWMDDMQALGAHDNVVCKLSGIVARAPQGWTAETLAPTVEHCIASFGADGAVFGGDWPVCTLGAPLGEWVAALRQIVKGHSEEDQRRILHDNAVRLYGLA